MSFVKALSGIAVGMLAFAGAAAAGEPSGSAEPTYSMALQQFYIRGDLGLGWHGVGEFSQDDLTKNTGTFQFGSIGESIVLGAGIGVQLNSHIRFDLTGEYRGKARLKARDNLTARIIAPDGVLQANTDYDGKLESIVGLLNGYIDLFTFRGITPYVGAGIGFANTKITGLTTSSHATFTPDVGVPTSQSSTGYSESNSRTELAWALMAGASLDISPTMKLDVGYRYLNLGSGLSAETGPLICLCGSIGSALKISDLESHEIRVGLRIALSAEERPLAHQPLK